MENQQLVRSTCELCNSGCGVLVQMADGKPVKVEGDPENPINRGALCSKGRASLEILYHPDRLKYPLKRAGARGEGKWQRVTWDEALDTIAVGLNKVKDKYGAESVAFMRGCAKGYQDSYMGRFANVFGSPNIASMSHICHVPRMTASVLTYGYMAMPDYEFPPALMMMWAISKCESAIGECKRSHEALSKGSKLIVIDPWESDFARKADIWLKPRPSTDLALALGMVNVIINQGLYNKEFVEKWTAGFDKLKIHVQDYTPEKVAEITWVPAESIKEVARIYATTKPASIPWGNGIDNNINNFQSARALCILRAITGNVGAPGGDIEWSLSSIVPKGNPELNQQDALSPEIRSKRIGADEGMLPTFYSALPQLILKAMLTGKPYPVRAALVQGGGLLHTYSDTNTTYRALNSLDFLVVTDFFMIPTAELADVVLPVATYLELDSFHESEYMPAVSVIQKVARIGECWSDNKIYIELAKHMGLKKYLWQEEHEALNFILKPAGMTFDEFRSVGVVSGVKQYRRHEKNGFNTPSGKVELFSSKLNEWGFDPLPVYHEPPETPYSEPELAEEYPLIFTNRKLQEYQHSGGRQIATLRGTRPDPIVHINSVTATNLGIAEGDWVYIENKRGKIKQRANLVPNIHPAVVIVDYGCWFPEKPASDDLHGYAESNLNVLTDSARPYGRELGSTTLRGLMVKVYKAD